ncbi:MAG: hypothetical protein E7321_09435 [Clostridiales bacterium]|nr:hypothetical protein [Clostridiales bacterium]
MRKKWVLALLLSVLLGICATAHALELPSNDVFSPGLKRLSRLEKTHPPVEASAQVAIDKAMYARDLSVLGAMLKDATIAYARSDASETVSIACGGEPLGTYVLPESAALDAMEARLLGVAVLERVPLASIADWLEGLVAGDMLAFGFAVSEPFVLERTMSDDGTRLTKIKVTGSISRAGEAPYRVSGYLRQPAGRAPKDTFELMFEQDEDNSIELLYSALRENEVTRKNKEGTASVRTTLKAGGKIAGSSMSSRLNVTMKNRWTSDGEMLSERISVTASLGLTDKRPGRRMLRLNDAAAEMKHVIRLTTHESGDEEIALSDEITLDVTLDSNTFLSGSADVSMRVGGEAAAAPQDVQEMDEASAKALAKEIYRTLDPKTLDTIHEGL